MMRGKGGVCARWVVLALAVGLQAGCAARWAYHQAQGEARNGNWDLAVARFTRALQKDPDNIGYKISLDTGNVVKPEVQVRVGAYPVRVEDGVVLVEFGMKEGEAA